ncbi:MAG: hypothetical protein ACRC9O_10220 [Plesiomonas sp.]|uniref:hypothetical protein n=1 Tax=Plesiomonas sp. TaxID=2486279 RepID=UPI003F3051D0
MTGIELSLRVAVYQYKINGTVDDSDAIIAAAIKVLPEKMKAHITEVIMWALARIY